MGKKAAKPKFKRAPGAPKRFKSAFMFYSEQQHKLIRSANPGKKVREIVMSIRAFLSAIVLSCLSSQLANPKTDSSCRCCQDRFSIMEAVERK